MCNMLRTWLMVRTQEMNAITIVFYSGGEGLSLVDK